MRRSRAVLLCVGLAILFTVLHFWLGWDVFVQDAATHGEKAVVSDYLFVWGRDEVENMLSEMWQLALQFAILAGLLKVIGVQAYEDDQETIKRRLDQLSTDLAEVRGARRLERSDERQQAQAPPAT